MERRTFREFVAVSGLARFIRPTWCFKKLPQIMLLHPIFRQLSWYKFTSILFCRYVCVCQCSST